MSPEEEVTVTDERAAIQAKVDAGISRTEKFELVVDLLIRLHPLMGKKGFENIKRDLIEQRSDHEVGRLMLDLIDDDDHWAINIILQFFPVRGISPDD
jgi:hypothetical protein